MKRSKVTRPGKDSLRNSQYAHLIFITRQSRKASKGDRDEGKDFWRKIMLMDTSLRPEGGFVKRALPDRGYSLQELGTDVKQAENAATELQSIQITKRERKKR